MDRVLHLLDDLDLRLLLDVGIKPRVFFLSNGVNKGLIAQFNDQSNIFVLRRVFQPVFASRSLGGYRSRGE